MRASVSLLPLPQNGANRVSSVLQPYMSALLLPLLLCFNIPEAMAQNLVSTVSIYGQCLTDQSKVGYSLEGFERFCSDSTQFAKGKVFRLDTTLSKRQCTTIVELVNLMQNDSICVEEVKDVGFKYRARFMLDCAGVSHDIYLSSSDLQFIMIDGVVYNRCKKLYKSLSSLVPKNFRQGLKLIDHFSHCCGAKGKQLPPAAADL